MSEKAGILESIRGFVRKTRKRGTATLVAAGVGLAGALTACSGEVKAVTEQPQPTASATVNPGETSSPTPTQETTPATSPESTPSNDRLSGVGEWTTEQIAAFCPMRADDPKLQTPRQIAEELNKNFITIMNADPEKFIDEYKGSDGMLNDDELGEYSDAQAERIMKCFSGVVNNGTEYTPSATLVGVIFINGVLKQMEDIEGYSGLEKLRLDSQVVDLKFANGWYDVTIKQSSNWPDTIAHKINSQRDPKDPLFKDNWTGNTVVQKFKVVKKEGHLCFEHFEQYPISVNK